MLTYKDLYGKDSGALCTEHKRILDAHDERYLEIFTACGEDHSTKNEAIRKLYDWIEKELQRKLHELLSNARHYYDEQFLDPNNEYIFHEFDMVRAPCTIDYDLWEVDNEYEENYEDEDDEDEDDEDEDEEKELYYRETLSRWYIQPSLYRSLYQAGAKVSMSEDNQFCFEYCGRGGSPLAAVHRWLYR